LQPFCVIANALKGQLCYVDFKNKSTVHCNMASGMDRTRFEGYTVLRTLGKGTFGVVYEVQPDNTQGSSAKDNTQQVYIYIYI